MDLFKVFFVILIAFTCQILAKPPINKNVESSKTLNSEEMEKEVAHDEEIKVNYSPMNNVESTKTLDSEEISVSEEIEKELSQENEEPELELSDPKIMNLEAMENIFSFFPHDEEVKVNYSPINIIESSKTLDSEEISASEEIEIELSQENEEPAIEFSDQKIMDLEAMENIFSFFPHDEEVKVNYSPINIIESSKTLDSEEISASEEIEIELSQENEGPELVFPGPKMDLETMEKEVAHDEEVKVNYSQSKSPFITRYISELKYQGVEKK